MQLYGGVSRVQRTKNQGTSVHESADTYIYIHQSSVPREAYTEEVSPTIHEHPAHYSLLTAERAATPTVCDSSQFQDSMSPTSCQETPPIALQRSTMLQSCTPELHISRNLPILRNAQFCSLHSSRVCKRQREESEGERHPQKKKGECPAAPAWMCRCPAAPLCEPPRTAAHTASGNRTALQLSRR